MPVKHKNRGAVAGRVKRLQKAVPAGVKVAVEPTGSKGVMYTDSLTGKTKRSRKIAEDGPGVRTVHQQFAIWNSHIKAGRNPAFIEKKMRADAYKTIMGAIKQDADSGTNVGVMRALQLTGEQMIAAVRKHIDSGQSLKGPMRVSEKTRAIKKALGMINPDKALYATGQLYNSLRVVVKGSRGRK